MQRAAKGDMGRRIMYSWLQCGAESIVVKGSNWCAIWCRIQCDTEWNLVQTEPYPVQNTIGYRVKYAAECSVVLHAMWCYTQCDLGWNVVENQTRENIQTHRHCLRKFLRIEETFVNITTVFLIMELLAMVISHICWNKCSLWMFTSLQLYLWSKGDTEHVISHIKLTQ